MHNVNTGVPYLPSRAVDDMSGTALLPAPNIVELERLAAYPAPERVLLPALIRPSMISNPRMGPELLSQQTSLLTQRRRSTEEKKPTMDSAVRRMSSFAFLPVLVIVLVAKSAVGFIAPSVHVAPYHVSPWAWQGVKHATCRSRCRVRSGSGLRWRGQSAGLNMVDPHVLRLQAAELGSRLKVGVF